MKITFRPFGYREYTPVAILAVLLGVAYFTVTGFDRPQIYLNILKNASYNGMIALGLLFVLICGDIDFSIGAQMSFYGVLFGLIIKNRGGIPLAAAATLAVAVLLGCAQGALVGRYRINSMIATIATSVMLSGLTYILAGGQPIFDLPQLPVRASARFYGISQPALIWILVAVLAALVLHQTYWGKFFYAVGCNATAAERAGVPAARTKMVAFSLCSLCCGICAVVYISQLGFSPLEAGQEATNSVLTIAALGGVSFTGGRGKVFPILCAALLLSALTSIFIVLRVPTYYQNCTKGVIIFLALITKMEKR